MESLLKQLNDHVRMSVEHVTGLLDRIREEPLSQQQTACLIQCRAVMERLFKVSDDISILTNVENLSVTQQSTTVLSDAVTEVTDLMAALASHKGLSLTLSMDMTSFQRVTADKNLLQESLRRVLDCAIRNPSSGDIRLSVSLMTTNPDKADLIMDVETSETGASGGEQGEIPTFEELALKVVEKRVSQVGGSLNITPNGEVGRNIRLTLPVRLASEAATLEDRDARILSRGQGPVRLLIAEDSDDSFLLIQRYLSCSPCQVTRAQDGIQAVEMAMAEEYDLIMMDANMPGMDGYSATRFIREWEMEKGRARIPILLMSADSRARQMEMGAQVGCSGYVPKPNTKDQVLPTLEFFLCRDLRPQSLPN